MNWRERGHPWQGNKKYWSKFGRGPALALYEYRIEQEPYTEGLPSIGYEQGYAIPHRFDRGIPPENHGKRSSYIQGCRCERCGIAEWQYWRRRKRREAARG